MFALLQKTSDHPPVLKKPGVYQKLMPCSRIMYRVPDGTTYILYKVWGRKSKGGRGGALHMRGFRKIENVMLSITIKERMKSKGH